VLGVRLPIPGVRRFRVGCEAAMMHSDAPCSAHVSAVLAEAGSEQLLSLTKNPYNEIALNPSKAVHGEGLIAMAPILIGLGREESLNQVPLRKAIMKEFQKTGGVADKNVSDLIAVTLRTGLGHCKRIKRNLKKARQALRSLTHGQRQTVVGVLVALRHIPWFPGGKAALLGSGQTLLTTWAQERDDEVLPESENPPESDEKHEDPQESEYPPDSGEKGSDLPESLDSHDSDEPEREEEEDQTESVDTLPESGTPKIDTRESQNPPDIVEDEEKQREVHDPFSSLWQPQEFTKAASKGGNKQVAKRPAGAPTTPSTRPTTCAVESTEKIVDKGTGKGKGKTLGADGRKHKYWSKSMGAMSLSLGPLRSEICCFPPATPTKRRHLATIDACQTPWHAVLATELVRLATSTDIMEHEFREVKRQKLEQCRQLVEPVVEVDPPEV
jgi:hypothetical protein